MITNDIAQAVTALASGKLCAIPTETVYGLAANALDESAVARVFAAKERPADHPLIVHVASASDVSEWITELPQWAVDLTNAVWPGPLTIVGPRTALASNSVTGNQDTVAVRVPSHPIAQELLRQLEAQGVKGVVAPSANRFGHVSPTSAAHVSADLGEYLNVHGDLILDGGDCQVGVESTIVLATGSQPVILRPGAVTAADIKRITGVEVSEETINAPRVSGALDSHYSPTAQVILITGSETEFENNAGFLALAQTPTPTGLTRLATPATIEDFAHELYSSLRAGDDLKLKTIYVVPPTGDGLAQAINDRLNRAAF
ncbi:MAG: L-threonylcarbamoyladenylate synthase [Actinobacteria bacterium]|nr:L-threonylcarbamoyladenylate synthase [Actinomycetota bacterium]